MFGKKKSFGDRIRELFKVGVSTESFFEELEDLLLEADLGTRATAEMTEELRQKAKQNKLSSPEDLEAALKESLLARVKTIELKPDPKVLNCFLFLGVNGVGKTTSIAKYASYLKPTYPGGIVLAAGDTFRAAATEQLVLHGQRLGIRTVSQGSGADAGAVIFDALESAKSREEGLVLADTAGRLHNKAHLVKELEKVDKIVRNKLGSTGVYKKILVIDATTGQNGMQQAEVFNEAVGVDAVVLSKYDSSARGGIVVSICGQLGLPIAFVGTGESYGDFAPFSAKDFVERLLTRRD